MTLIKELMEEIKRNVELMAEYKLIPTGFIGASMIQIDIQNAEKSIQENNAVEMLRSFEKLKNNN